jgi:hypothetical protein
MLKLANKLNFDNKANTFSADTETPLRQRRNTQEYSPEQMDEMEVDLPTAQ